MRVISLFTDPLFSLQTPSSTREQKLLGDFIGLQRKQGVRGGEGENRPSLLLSVDILGAAETCFSQEKQIIIKLPTMSVYRLHTEEPG